MNAPEGNGSAPSGVAAFFDVDGTVLSVQSGTLYVADLRRRGMIARSDHLRLLWGFVTYRLGMVNLHKMAEVTSRWLRGRTEQEIADHCRQWYLERIRSTLRPEVVAAVDAHRRRGHTLALLTSGTHYLNDHIAADLGIEHVLATELEVHDGRFTGRVQGRFCYGRGKVAKAEEFARLQGVSLERSFFYSDSVSDLPMLERVGNAVVVAPDPRLRLEARRRGWPLLDADSSAVGLEEA